MAIDEPLADAKEIFALSREALMAHTIRGVVNYFHHHGVTLDLRVSIDDRETIYRECPLKSSILAAYCVPPKGKSPYSRVEARIFIRKGANHHLRRLCIAHEIYHLLIGLRAYVACKRTTWDKWKPEHEELCNKFAQELCSKHNEFYKKDEEWKKRTLFPDELFADGFSLNLGDVSKLPNCLR